MSLNVANCPMCGKLYAKNPRNACPACVKEIEEQYNRCMQFLKENRRCSINELSEGTDVSVNQITAFIREGRISIGDFPNITLQCEVCGTSIREGHLCEACRLKLSKDLRNIREDERKWAQRQLEQGNGFLKDRKS